MLSRGEKYFFRPAGSFCTFFLPLRRGAPEVFRQAFLQKGRPSPRRSACLFRMTPPRRPLSPAPVSCPSARGLLFPVSPSHRPRVFGTLLRIRMEAVRQVAFLFRGRRRFPRRDPRGTLPAEQFPPLRGTPLLFFHKSAIIVLSFYRHNCSFWKRAISMFENFLIWEGDMEAAGVAPCGMFSPTHLAVTAVCLIALIAGALLGGIG